MLTKVLIPNGQKCRVTFHVSPEIRARIVHLCGDFNNWSTSSHPMEPHPDGSFSLALELRAGRNYRFRYFVDGYCWFNDDAADAYVTNQHDNLESVVQISQEITQ